jgi:hypothetical protein
MNVTYEENADTFVFFFLLVPQEEDGIQFIEKLMKR